MMEGMTTPPRTPVTTVPPSAAGDPSSSPRRGPNGRFIPRPETGPVEVLDRASAAVEEPPMTSLSTSTSATDDAEELPDDRFLNRELSWLDFNARVLALAEDPETPLLERAKFLAIFASNLDEFYMVRVAGLKRRLSAALPMRGGDRISLRGQLEMITERSAD